MDADADAVFVEELLSFFYVFDYWSGLEFVKSDSIFSVSVIFGLSGSFWSDWINSSFLVLWKSMG